jgi:hypothetical protein
MYRLGTHWKRWALLVACCLVAAAAVGALGARGAATSDEISFDIVRSAAVAGAGCLPHAGGHVTIESVGPVEVMRVSVHGLPPETEFDLFVIQVPNGPFGLAWYQGDIETDEHGGGHGTFVGRFSIETFIVAPGVPQPAPTPHGALDADTNPTTKPVHTFHLGLWFNSPADAVNAGCLANTNPLPTTPFNGDHTAGPQVLSTRDAPDLQGPLGRLGS